MLKLCYYNVLILSVFLLPIHSCSSLENVPNDDNNTDSIKPTWQTSRSIKGLVLENGLKLILISDPVYAVTGSGSLYIAAGSMSTPVQLQGLPHLLEHMLFNGNSKYPESEAFSKFATANAGSVGASTGLDFTEYRFSVSSTALNGALDHLFNMINSPLFNVSSVRDEVTVVNSEYNKYFPMENRRFQQVERFTSRKGHAYNVFPNGNEESLWTKPTQLGFNVTEELIKFHTHYYSSNLMTLTVLGNVNMTELESMVVPLFSQLVNRNTTLPSWTEPPYSKAELGVKIEIVPKSGEQYLALCFPILKEDIDVFNNYYASLLIHGGNTSLYTLLKSKDLINTIMAGVSEKYRGYQEFYIAAFLTDYGVLHYKEAILHMFEFINFLRATPPQKWYWDEIKEIAEIHDKFKTRDEEPTLVDLLSFKMIESSPEKVIQKYENSTRIEFNATKISQVLDYFTPENMRIYFESDILKNTTTLIEPHYKVDFNLAPLDTKLIRDMKTMESPFFTFPLANEYIPKNFSLKPLQNNTQNIPISLNPSNYSRLWYLQDSYYFVPKVIIYVKIFNPHSYSTPVDSGLMYLFYATMEDRLRPLIGLVRAVGSTISLTDRVFGLQVQVSGFSDGIDRVLHKIMTTIATSSESISNESFYSQKEIYRQRILGWQRRQPCSLTESDILLKDPYWTPTQLYAALDGITPASLDLFSKQFLSRIQMEWLIYGNILENEAIELVKSSEDLFIKQGSRPGIATEFKWQLRNVQIPQGTNWLYKIANPVDNRTCAKIIFQSSTPGLEDAVKITLLSSFMEQPASVALRTKEQLGYDLAVYSGREIGYSSNSLDFYVQGERNPSYVEERMNNFLIKFRENLQNMTEEEFKERQQAQRGVWDTTSNEIDGYIFWKEIYYGHYTFNRKARKIILLEGLSLKGIQDFYDELIGFQGDKQRRLSIHVSPDIANDGILVENKIETSQMDTTTNAFLDEYLDTTTSYVTENSLDDDTTTETQPDMLVTTKSVDSGQHDDKDDLNNTIRNSKASETQTERDDLTFHFLNVNTTEIKDVASWKRKQYLFPTPGLEQ